MDSGEEERGMPDMMGLCNTALHCHTVGMSYLERVEPPTQLCLSIAELRECGREGRRCRMEPGQQWGLWRQRQLRPLPPAERCCKALLSSYCLLNVTVR